VEPTDFLKTAELLASEQEESHLRTSIGRSYYSAYLHFREYLRKLGFVNKKYESHFFVSNLLSNSKNNEAIRVSAILNDLKQVRTDADYELDISISVNEAKDTLAKARKVINDFVLTKDTEAEIVKEIKNHIEQQKALGKSL